MHVFWLCILFTVRISAVTFFPSTDRDPHIRLQTLPQLRPPLLDVTIYDAERLSPGYLFLAPYSQLAAKKVTDSAEAYITGPFIYDHNGQLIWIGSTLFPGRDAYDFKAVMYKGETMLSFIISPNEFYPEYPEGMAVLINGRYELVNMTLPLFDTPEINIHEYRIIDNGASVLTLYSKPVLVNDTWIMDDGLAEIDLDSGATLFHWSSLEHIPLNASNFHLPKADSTSEKQAWDWFHANSIDKNAHGDYLLSSRHTSTIFKISGSDGSILWTLSGKSPDIDHSNGFNFSWQHDARYIYENQTTSIISFFDNAGVGIDEESKTTGNWSRAVVVEFNTFVRPMTTRILHSYDRPDHEISIARGNMQTLSNSNVFIGWATHGLISELTQDGSPVMEAKFRDPKMSTYRSYKFNFTGHPHFPPVTKSIVYGSSPKTANTFHYISWNGATDVHSWNLYGATKNSSESFSLLAKVEKTDFETMYMTKDYIAFVYVEAIDVDGRIMRASIAAASEVPQKWIGTFCTASSVCEIKSEETSQEEHESVGSDITGLRNPESDHLDSQLKYQPGSTSLTRVVEDKTLILGIGLLAVSAFVYLFLRLFRRRDGARYQHVE
ncbi:hypothetical protein M436DRAFT_69474 [Aureobasidium namibiae CBS 147.97]|uniref:Arylsulfotransferase n=1 Tax=Aureobasidium namibiae CBS 147.97 TaxID=1043004 RepID=A0A074WY86_9PEZI|nr:uncharacterized protein M436DRAFT_69474 [Aureobasidium namibiae CBS 147.97]KEQ76484.1 hypothetical protein M436DRAFT_69474 [Aureobasidium namibiae CBS 147.97]